ncbi:LysM domain receptor-like kinase 3 [Linum grandiflorum]
MTTPTTPSYRTVFRGREAIGFRRVPPPDFSRDRLKHCLSLIGMIRHANIVQLIGASMPAKDRPYVSVVYEFINAPTLSDCLTTGQTVDLLSTWASRMEVALGVARGLDYIHNRTGLDAVFVHNRIKSSNILLHQCSSSGRLSTRAMICNFGLAHADGETAFQYQRQPLMEDEEGYPYLSPELLQDGVATQESDVYAFGVLLLELISGQVPLTYRRDEASGVYVRMSIVETARAMFEGDNEDEAEEKVKCWVDRQLDNIFPAKVAMKAIRVALLCVGEDPKSRPDMGFVEGLIYECTYARRFFPV